MTYSISVHQEIRLSQFVLKKRTQHGVISMHHFQDQEDVLVDRHDSSKIDLVIKTNPWDQRNDVPKDATFWRREFCLDFSMPWSSYSPFVDSSRRASWLLGLPSGEHSSIEMTSHIPFSSPTEISKDRTSVVAERFLAVGKQGNYRSCHIQPRHSK